MSANSYPLTVHGSRVLRRWLLTAGLTALGLGSLAAAPGDARAQGGEALGLGVSDGRHQQLRLVASGSRRNDHDDRPVLAPALLASRRFSGPEVGIGKDVSGLGDP